MTPTGDRSPGRAARLVERGAGLLYRALLLSYPRGLRHDIGGDATVLFADACRADWTRAGIKPLSRRVLAAVFAVPVAGLAERRQSRPPRVSTADGSGGPAFFADLRHAMRALRRHRGLSAAVIATLAIGLGVNTAVFSVLDATLLRPSPYVHAGRAAWLQAALPSGEKVDPKLAWVRTWAAGATSIERIEARRWRSVLITGAGSATRERLIEATPGYLQSIGARPVMGRLLVADDSISGAAPVVVISAGLWRERYGAQPDLVGRLLKIDGVEHQIVGVASEIPSDVPGLRFRLATPMADELAASAGAPTLVVAWIKPAVSFDRAAAEMNALTPVVDDGRALRATLSRPRNIFWSIQVFRTIELGIAAAAVLLLIIAGVNVANLLLAAGQARAGDLAVRRALGASTLRLVRLQLIETTTLALAGTAIGLGLAWAAVRGFAAINAGPQLQTALESIRIDPVVAGYAVGLALLTAIVFGLLPALRGARASGDVRSLVSRSSTVIRRGPSMLVAVETGMAAVLLVAAGLVAHAFLSMHFAERGFDADRILGMRIALPQSKYPSPAARAAFFDALLDEAGRLPGVERAGIGYGATPPSDFVAMGELTVAGSVEPPTRVTPAMSFVTPGYFALMGIPLLQGRDFTLSDSQGSAAGTQPAVVSRSFAEQLWSSAGAVGARFEIADRRRTTRYQIVGVAGDVSVWGLLSRNCLHCDPQLYVPLPDQRQFTDVLLRIRPGARPPMAALQAAVARLDPDVPSDDELQTAEASLADFIRQPRFIAALLSTFAILAVLLVAVGLSAVVSHAVARRSREMGIRMALGATLASVRRLVITQGLRPAVTGLAAGLSAAALLTRFMDSVLYGMSPLDPLTLVAAPALLMAIAIIALLIPAIRATRVDPVQTLRAD